MLLAGGHLDDRTLLDLHVHVGVDAAEAVDQGGETADGERPGPIDPDAQRVRDTVCAGPAGQRGCLLQRHPAEAARVDRKLRGHEDHRSGGAVLVAEEGGAGGTVRVGDLQQDDAVRAGDDGRRGLGSVAAVGDVPDG